VIEVGDALAEPALELPEPDNSTASELELS
jgi:hypothetical protein